MEKKTLEQDHGVAMTSEKLIEADPDDSPD
jgi:hypothetical protein